MSEPLVLKTNATPSYFNKDTLLGLLIAGPLGVVVGAFVGKRRLEDERVNGKIVTQTPSFWNKDTLLGGLLGSIASGVAASLSFFAITGATMTAVVAGVVLAPAALLTGAAVAGTLALGGIALGAYAGGKLGQSRLTYEYEEAKKQHIVNHITRTVSPEVGKAVEYSLEHNKEWGKQVSEDRLLAEAQQQQALR